MGKLLVVIFVRDVDGNFIKYFIISGDIGNIFKINDIIGVFFL